MAIIDDLVKENKKVYKVVKAKIEEDLGAKIKQICDTTGIKEEDYLGRLLEASEIDKVYKELTKESNISTKIDENSD